MPEITGNWKTQYGDDFRFKRKYQRREQLRVTSPQRKNNPHPVEDFLIYNRMPIPKLERQKDAIRRHLMNEYMSRGTRSALPRVQAPPTSRPDDGADKITSIPLSQGDRHKISRPKTTVGPVIRGDYHELCEPGEHAEMSQTRDLERFMAGNLSPRKSAAPPGMPGRSYTHYHGYAMPVTYVGALDLQAPNFTYATGQQRPVNNYTVYGPPPPERRPMHQHQGRGRKSDDYVHNHSIFTTTNPSSRGYYIINPDWVSERFSMRRSKSLLSF